MFRLAKTKPHFLAPSALVPTLGTICASLTFVAAVTLRPMPASSLPSYARQTGQPCATCHTTFPELTPYGRRFKLGGYTAGGTRCRDEVRPAAVADALRDYLNGGQGGSSADSGGSRPFDARDLPAISVMVLPSFTHTDKAQDPTTLPPGVSPNDNWQLQTVSVFYGGQIYCDFGAFIQGTHDANSPYSFMFLDNTDIRFAKTGKVLGQNVLFGLTMHNNPTVQDVWNSTPAWGFPYAASGVAPGPAASTMIEGAFAGRVIGNGAYVFVNDLFYAEVTAYQTMNSATLSALGLDPLDNPDRFSGAAPYWRFALEKNWDQHSFMVGTFGMLADIFPGNDKSAGTDRILDVGFDTQYQYLGDVHGITARVSYIEEKQNRDASLALGLSDNRRDYLNSFKALLAYHYEIPPLTGNKITLTGTYFNLQGSTDATLFGTPTGSPNSAGWIGEVAWSPFSRGNIAAWPWLNMRIGVQYTAYTKFDGSSTNVDGNGRKASDNNTLFSYVWTAF